MKNSFILLFIFFSCTFLSANFRYCYSNHLSHCLAVSGYGSEESNFDIFLAQLNSYSVDELKSAISDFINLNADQENLPRKEFFSSYTVSDNLRDLHKALKAKIKYISNQKKYKYLFDRKALSIFGKWIAGSTLLLVLAYLSYKKSSKESADFESFKANLTANGIKVDVHYGYPCITYYNNSYVTSVSHVLTSNQLSSVLTHSQGHKIIQQYKALSKDAARSNDTTVFLGLFSLCGFFGTMEPLYKLLTTDPNRYNKYLLDYVELLGFVREQLQKLD